jgi:TonB family protein
MSRAAAIAPVRPYRLPLFGAPEREMRRALQVAAVVGAAVLLAVYLAPVRAPEITDVDKVPERFARLILQEPPAPPAPLPAPAVRMPAPPEVAVKTPAPVAAVVPPRPAPRREAVPKVAPDHGTTGRERAKEQVAQLEKVKESVDQVLADVTTSLASTDDGVREHRPSRRRARSGRSAAEVTGVDQVRTSTGATAAAIPGTRIELGSAAEAGLPGARATRADGSAAAAGEIRTDADLMAVVRRYAPALQFCYDNELKKSPSLGGKLVVGITVAASGRVTDAAVVRDTVGSAAMVACALAQIEAWRFPAVPEGTVTFQAPFVFTPPR